MRYAIVIEKTEESYSAYAPDLPGCVATGATPEAVACASVFVAVNGRHMPFHVHCIVKHAANANEARRHRPVKQKMTRLSHARRGRDARPAVAKVVGADAIPDFGPRGAAGPKRIDGDIAKANGEQRFVAEAGRFAELLFRSREDVHDIVFR
jgi:hypothetical protein